MAEYEGLDPLLAAITDEELPEGARHDVLFMAEHRAAAADLDALREQLVVIGDALADSGGTEGRAGGSRSVRGSRGPGGGGSSPASRRSGDGRPGSSPGRRSRLRVALAVGAGTLAAAAVASMVVGLGRLVTQGSGDRADEKSAAAGAKADSGSRASLSAPGYIACSRLLVEGTVTGVTPVPGTTRDRVTLDVYHYYKPATGERKVTFLMDRNVVPRLHRGEEALIGIQRHASTPDIWTTGEQAIARERSWIVKALPESLNARCAE